MSLQYPDGFIAKFYAISESVSPVLAWAFLGPEGDVKSCCLAFKVWLFLSLSQGVFQLENDQNQSQHARSQNGETLQRSSSQIAQFKIKLYRSKWMIWERNSPIKTPTFWGFLVSDCEEYSRCNFLIEIYNHKLEYIWLWKFSMRATSNQKLLSSSQIICRSVKLWAGSERLTILKISIHVLLVNLHWPLRIITYYLYYSP